jgi:hypothetical protein
VETGLQKLCMGSSERGCANTIEAKNRVVLPFGGVFEAEND